MFFRDRLCQDEINATSYFNSDFNYISSSYRLSGLKQSSQEFASSYNRIVFTNMSSARYPHTCLWDTSCDNSATLAGVQVTSCLPWQGPRSRGCCSLHLILQGRSHPHITVNPGMLRIRRDSSDFIIVVIIVIIIICGIIPFDCTQMI